MIHVDLFSGIGGCALACEWAGIETIGFVEIDPFCQKVLRRHWPGVEIVEDVNDIEAIRRIVTNATGRGLQEQGLRHEDQQPSGAVAGNGQIPAIKRAVTDADQKRRYAPIAVTGSVQFICREPFSQDEGWQKNDGLLLTAGFPCQPFSCAGRRSGANDDRYLWPATLAVIAATRPEWVLLENVPGILSMVFPDSAVPVASQASFLEGSNDEIADYDTIIGGIERDLRAAGYETVWLVIPACGVGAPHRRDRVWIVAHAQGQQVDTSREGGLHAVATSADSHAADAGGQGLEVGPVPQDGRGTIRQEREATCPDHRIPGWQEDWYEAATRLCRVHDGIPHRVDRLKALGNAIVPQVAYEIIKGIKGAQP
ncbi:MAG: DNA cytosine methyltransferase [Dehalococcoidia bacterium]|jgi:DNA (cytosine-5)-methyltransferase 1